MYKDKKIGVVMPAYNEEGFVGDAIRSVPDFVDRVYVVDDCSTDDTWHEIEKAALDVNGAPDREESEPEPEMVVSDGGHAAARRVVPIKHEKNKGVGGAIKTGYFRGYRDKMDVLAVMAADGQMDPDILDEIIDPVVEGQADYSKGNRLLNSQFWEEMSRWRLFGNSLLTLLTKIATGYWKMMDPQNGYTAISREAIEDIPLDDVYDGFGFANDLLVKLNVYGKEIADVSMPAKYDDEESHINYRTFVPVLSWLLLKNFFWRLKTKYLIRDFHPLVLFYSFGIALAGVGTFLGGWAIFKKVVDGLALFVPASMSLMVFTLGTMFVLFAMLFDMQENEGRETRDYA